MKKSLKLVKDQDSQVVEYDVEIVGKDLVDINSGEVLFTASESLNLVETPDKELAIGLAFPTNMNTPTDYLKGLSEYKLAKDQNIEKIFEVCDNMYRFEGVVGSTVDLYVDLANTELILQDVENDSAREVLEYINKNLNKSLQVNSTGIKSFIEQGMTHWFVFGNAFPYKNWRDVKIGSSTYSLPINIIYMNPHAIDIDEDLVPLGIEDITLQVPERLLNKKLPDMLKDIESVKDLKKTYNNGKRFGTVEVPLDPDKVTHIKRKSRDWDAWGIPFLLRAFSAVSSKKRLRRLDDATTDGLVNYLTIFKLGATDTNSPYHKVSQNRLNAFASLIKNPTASTTLVWSHDIAVETAGPDSTVLKFDDKYASADKDIINSLGVGALLVDSGEASEESVLVLVEILESLRSSFLSYITELYEEVLETNNLKSDFKVRFSNIKLSDILQKLKNLVLSYYDRGLLSFETVLTLGGHDFAQEIARKEKEKEMKEDGLFDPPKLPFSINKDGQSSPTNDDGRPDDNTDERDENKDNVEDESDPPEESRSVEWTKADEEFLMSFSSVMNQKIDVIKSRLIEKASNNELKDYDINLALTAGFADISTFSDDTFNGVFESVVGEFVQINKNTLIKQQLNDWTYAGLVKIRNSIAASLEAAAKSNLTSENQELFVPIIEAVFANHNKRLDMFAKQSLIKARVASGIEVKVAQGMVGAYWLSEGGKCDVCQARHNNFYKPKNIFKIFPAHPGCACQLEWSEVDGTVNNTAVNNSVVVTTNNPSKHL